MMVLRSHCFYYFISFFFLILHTLASPTLDHCRRDQRDALLEFKGEFPNANDTSFTFWDEKSDCCSWEDVECDAKSGKVISLYLRGYSLHNSLKPNSSLFKLQHLQNLDLSDCSLYGEIPFALGNFSHLTDLVLSENKLGGKFPTSILNLSQLRNLDLSNCSLYGEVPFALGNLSHLTYLDLNYNELVGQLPTSILNLTQLIYLGLTRNKLSGKLPPDMSGLQNLEIFVVSENSFSGAFPTYLFTIPSLRTVDLKENQFKGPMEFGNTSSSSSLEYLYLGYNQFDGPIPESVCEFLNLSWLDLGHNNFNGQIPRCISKLVNLTDLDLRSNNLEGEVPTCLWRLRFLLLSHNSFTSFEKSWEVINVSIPIEKQVFNLAVLDLNSNSFQGPFPRWICKFSSLWLLDLSNNNFSGSIPTCLRNSIEIIQNLIMNDNNFSGIIPDIFHDATFLKALDVGSNQLVGKLPRSLINCKGLEFLNVESNGIKDKFPNWLPWLSVLILRSNEFYGSLLYHNESIGFQSLIKVIDISHNDFSETLPSFYFHNWSEMMAISEDVGDDDSPYMDLLLDSDESFSNSMEMMHKGTNTKFDRIRRDFRAIDFSGNKFHGNIPPSIGMLKELRLLNLSGNAFSSNIPQSLANLTKLEGLDLSRNQLSGQIPQNLGSLSFLSAMNFSHNNLEGPIPRGTQFQSQNCSSFKDNPKLSGLEQVCGETRVPNLPPQETEELSKPEEQWINWKAAAIAYGPGVFCGLVIGHIFASHKHKWLMEKFGRSKPRVVTMRAR